MSWYVYLLRCKDNTLYCGSTSNLRRRVEEHSTGVHGARYTVGRLPVKLVWSWPAANRSEAQKLEARIKRMSKQAKERLVRGE